MAAIQNRHVEIAILLIQNGAQLDLQNKYDIIFINRTGSTALIMAAHTGQYDLVELLLNRGAEKEIQNQ